MKNICCSFALLSLLACISCNDSKQKETKPANNYDKMEQASWLLGNWQNISPQGNSTEIWKKENDSVYAGKSWLVKGADTLLSEAISMIQTTEGMFYIPVVKDQNNGEAVKFTLTSSSDHQMIFENPAHDFPQKIIYTLINSDSLMAEISGSVNGKESAQQFPLNRIK